MERMIELEGFGDHKPLYLLAELCRFTGDLRDSAAYVPGIEHGPYELLHVVSRPAGGEVRGYVLQNGVAHLRHPTTPLEWSEVDAAVAAALGVTVSVVIPF